MTIPEHPRLRGPLVRYLRHAEDENAVGRIRARLFSGEPEPQRTSRSQLSRFAPPAWAWALSVAVAAALGLWVWQTTPEERLHLADGGDFVGLRTADQSKTLRLSDGSTLHLGPGGSLLPLTSSAHEFSLLLERGRVEVSVIPGGPRKWRIETKFAQVEVVGTEFSIERAPASLQVQVRHGVVVVRSPLLTEGATRLSAGQQVVLKTSSAPPELKSVPAPAPLSLPRLSSASSQPSAKSEPVSIEASLREADSARLRGDWPQAATLYGALHARLLRTAAGDSRLPLIHFTWATALQGAGDARTATRELERLLAAKAPSSLRQDAWLRLVECYLAQGNRQAAVEAAARYRSEFPQGRHRLTLSGLLKLDPEAGMDP